MAAAVVIASAVGGVLATLASAVIGAEFAGLLLSWLAGSFVAVSGLVLLKGMLPG